MTFGIGFEIARDDKETHADLDGALLDVPPVADDDDRLVGGDALALGDFRERAHVHGAHAHKELLDGVGVGHVEDAGFERAGVFDRLVVTLPFREARGCGHEVAAELRDRNGAEHPPVGGQDRQHAQVMMLDQLERFGAGGAFADRDDMVHHEVANARSGRR